MIGPEGSTSTSRRRRLRLGLSVVVFVGVGAFITYRVIVPTEDRLLTEVRSSFERRDYRQTLALAERLLERFPESAQALLLSGRAALELGLCSQAEETLRQALANDGGNVEARRSLARLLLMEGRYWELLPHARAVLQHGDLGDEYLLVLAAPDNPRISDRIVRFVEACRSVAPNDALPALGMARFYLQVQEVDHALGILEKVVRARPDQIEAQAQLGSALLDINDDSRFSAWHRQLPPAADEHPEIWYLRGMRARVQEQHRVAIRCFWEAVLRDPNHRRANYQLSRALISADALPSATEFAHRFEELEELSRLTKPGEGDRSDQEMTPKTMYRIGQLMESLGRPWEAAAWYEKAFEHSVQFDHARRDLQRVEKQLDDETPLTLSSSNPAHRVDLSNYPLPEWQASGSSGVPGQVSSPADSNVAFVDEAESAGLSFRYFNGAEPQSDLARMFEFSGGGVAVLDYNGDLWPDVYLTQGCPWPPAPGQQRYRDRLFQNVGGERFEDVTERCGLGDGRYSQGATVGDFNSDGFPDLYVANIGANRFYENNGDGTFTDVTDATGTAGNEWTLSCLLADLNGDAAPDLYCVNYLGGPDVFDRRCKLEGRPVQCPVNYFPAEQDRLYRNLGDGRYRDVTDDSGIVVSNGKGMGIVAADFDASGRLSLFVANDTTPNFFFVPDGQVERPDEMAYSNRGVVSGLAFGELGESQSCMGVASGDLNGDGLLDLYVTNFTAEHNNLYLQRAGTLFQDHAREAGLHLDTVRQMGWGAQCVDADLDGLIDLVVANGHLDENTSGTLLPYKMRAQFFRNLGGGRFALLPAERVGPYFNSPHAGRAVAVMDWNRDGLEDVCLTHVDAPVALLTNRTSEPGNHLSIRLYGVDCSRDAVGAIVRVVAGDKVWVRHLTAGDGFQASNERKVAIGLGETTSVDHIVVSWPSGRQQTIPHPTLNTEFVVVEGRPPTSMKTF